jgi:TonB-dependent starch-binding outer membrane protein SusC
MIWNKFLTLLIAVSLIQTVSGQKSGKKSDETLTISGKVLNKDHNPVVGAVFYIDNMKTSYSTKSDGTYKIKVSTSAINIEVRAPESGTCKVPINGQTDFNFLLDGENSKVLQHEELDRLNKSGENNTRKERSKGKKMNTYNDIYQMIRAEVTGVIVNGRSIQIQQGHSFFGSSTPLFVVNGNIVNSIDNINPLEVKSIVVLKGSAAAIYGVQGSNGVLKITLINSSEK